MMNLIPGILFSGSALLLALLAGAWYADYIIYLWKCDPAQHISYLYHRRHWLDITGYVATAMTVALVGGAEFGLYAATKPEYLVLASIGCIIVGLNCAAKRAWSGVIINTAFGIMGLGALLVQWR